MNAELKAMLDMVFDSEKLIEKIVAKQNFIMWLPQVLQILTADLPKIVANWSDLQAELKALPGSAEEADLVAYIQLKFKDAVDSPKAQAILNAILSLVTHLAQDILALQAAFKS